MFVNCPSCRGLVATDPATDQPPDRCPRCAAPLRGATGTEPAGDDARSGVATALAEAFGAPATGAAKPQDDPAARPAVSVANLLIPADPDDGPEREPTAPGPAPGHAVVPSLRTGTDAHADTGPPANAAAGRTPEAVSGTAADSSADSSAETASEAASGSDAAHRADPRAQTGAVPASVPAPAPAAPPRTRRTAGRAAPSFARPRRGAATAAASGRRWPMPAAVAGLALLLGLQWLLADRARLAADPGWRPLVEGACTVLRCSLPPWHEPRAFTLLERDVRPHPDAADALRITASFRNDAAWPQAWPEVVLTLSDIDGRPLGARAFSAEEYLGDAPAGLLDSGQGAVIRMDVLEPGPGAVSFAFDFR